MTNKPGFTKVELIVSAFLISCMIAIASPIFHRLGSVWSSTRLYQLASLELMNHMDDLTRMKSFDCKKAILELAMSPEIAATIPHATLSGRIETTDDQHRIVLQVQLPTNIRSEPIVLVGWLQHGDER